MVGECQGELQAEFWMAHWGCPPTCYTTHYKKTIASDLEALATFLIATAEDNNEELIALAMAAAAIKARQNAQSKKHGLWGLYN